MTTRSELGSHVEYIRSRFFEDPGTFAAEAALCRKIDEVILEIWNGRNGSVPFALFAIGGYGRGVLHPASDIDLLFLFSDSIDQDVVKAVLHPLWDFGFRIGHQIRQPADFVDFEPDKMQSYTAFFESRFLLGDRYVVEDFQKKIIPGFIRKHRSLLLDNLIEIHRVRHRRFGNTVFQLEPDLKEAPGGLRDAHWATWVQTVFETSDGEPVAPEMLSFHYRLRNFLHFLAGRDLNVLSYDYQEEIAGHLGYQDSERGEAAENLMRDYFLSAGAISRVAAAWEEAIVGSPNRLSIRSNFRDPRNVIGAFAEAHRMKARLDADTLKSIQRAVPRVSSELWGHREFGQAVLAMMKAPAGIYETLLAMHGVGVLGRVFPEFEEIRCRVIRDFFHKYTVDEHSLIAIRNIEELQSVEDPTFGRFRTMFGELEHPELLLLALLFHDIGKASRHPVGDHVHPSAEGVADILGRIGIPEEEQRKVVFVIANHLEMSKIILRRDFSDEDVIRQFADVVGTVDGLRMLCLLTYADMKAVSPDVLTAWKADLLWQLYVETYYQLMHGLADDRYTQQPDLDSEIGAVRQFLGDKVDPQEVRYFLDGFPRQYLKTTSKDQIAEHFLLSRQLARRPMVMHLAPRDGFYELLVMTADQPFLFYKITGALSYFDMNIIRGQAFANRQGNVFDLIMFEDPQDSLAKNPSEIGRFEHVLEGAIHGTVNIDELLHRKMTSVVYRQRKGFVPTSVHFDHEFSKRCTVMEIVAQDAFGLLFGISRVISTHGCNIEVVLITTEGNRAIDVFYLTHNGTKVSAELEQQLQADLAAALAPVAAT